MSDLGDLLETLHNAGRFRTARAVLRTWADDELRTAAFRAEAEAQGAVMYAQVEDDAEEEKRVRESESEVRLWIALPDHFRVEYDEKHLAIKVGQDWWSWNSNYGATTSVGADTRANHSVGEEWFTFLRPGSIISALDWIAEGRDGSVLLASARPRETLAQIDQLLGHGLHSFGSGADEYRFAIDAATGAVRRSEALFRGRPFQVTVTTELELDSELPPETFVFEAPDGAIAEPWEGRPTRFDYTISEIVELASFTLLVPERVPDGWRLTSHYLPASKRPLMSESATLFYRSDDGTAGVSISQSRAGDRVGAGAFIEGRHWEEMERDGVAFRFRGRSEHWQQPQLYMERDGTAVLMTSDTLSNDDMIELALRMRAASGGSALADS